MNVDVVGLEILDHDSLQRDIDKSIRRICDASDLNKHSVTISLVDESTIEDLSARFKKKKKITDVLSFPVPEMERLFPHTKNLLGDVIICVPQAARQAKEFGHTLLEEIAVLCAHGLFHLLGYDHERSDEEANIQMQGEMFLLEKAGFAPELSLIGRV